MKSFLKYTDYEIDAEISEKFDLLYRELVKNNAAFNITAITDEKEVYIKHFADSLSLVKCVNDMTDVSYSLLDIGTGAGFPGIPLKIVFPHLHVTLFDSLNTRINFLNEVIDTLSLNEEGSITTLHGRAEDYASKKEGSLRESFDIVV